MAAKILVPFDFSPASVCALEWAAEYAKLAKGSVTVVHVMVPAYMASAAGLPAVLPTEDDIKKVEQGLKESIAKIAPGASVLVEEAPVIGPAVRDLASESGTTLIVVGTHGRGGITRAVLGSVADDLVRHANCPVVTLRAPATK